MQLCGRSSGQDRRWGSCRIPHCAPERWRQVLGSARSCAVALGDFGEAAREALPALEVALDYDCGSTDGTWDARAREAVGDAIERIKDPSAASSLPGHGYRYEFGGIY